MKRHTLPVQYSIVEPASLEVLVTTLYGWTRVRCQLIKGTMRDIYEVWADQQHAILCIYRQSERTIAEIESETAVTQHLHNRGFVVPLPIALADGSVVFSLAQPEGTRFGMMMTFVRGAPVGRQLTPTMGMEFGEFLAKNHIALSDISRNLDRPVMDFEMAMTTAIVAFESAAPHRQHDIELLRHAQNQCRKALLMMSYEQALYGIFHGDIIPSNILWYVDRFALLDFDLCAYGWQIYDVASFLVEIAYWSTGYEVSTRFLQGYEHHCPLSQSDRILLIVLKNVRCLIGLGIPARYVNTWGRVYFSDAIIDRQMLVLQGMLADMAAIIE